VEEVVDDAETEDEKLDGDLADLAATELGEEVGVGRKEAGVFWERKTSLSEKESLGGAVTSWAGSPESEGMLRTTGFGGVTRTGTASNALLDGA
jgi:hypothetical protein